MPSRARVALCLIIVSAYLVAPAAVAAEPESCAADARNAYMTACFAPKTDPGYIEEIARRVIEQAVSLSPPLSEFQFQDGSRWSQTASGSGFTQGDPTVLTWSYVPDGTSIAGFAGEGTRDSNLYAWLDGIYGNFNTWHALFVQVFDNWGDLTGITYIYEPNDDGRAFTASSLPPGVLGTRGDVRIAAHRIDGTNGILAYNFFPNLGDMVIDSADGNFNNTGQNSRVLRNTLAHEHGHGLGIEHVCPINNSKLMEPILATGFDGVQHDDTLAGNRGYGDRLEHNDFSGTASPLGAISTATPTTLTNLSIDDNGDVDYFSVDVTTPIRLTVNVDPVGLTYRSGPQNGNGSCSPGTNFNSLRQHDLSIDLLDTDGSSVLITADATGLGAGEEITDFILASPGTYFVRVDGGSGNVVQLYDLMLSASTAANAPVLDVDKSVSPTLAEYAVGTDVTYTIDVTNIGTARANNVEVQDCLDATLDPGQVTPLDGGVLGGGTAPPGCLGDWITWTLPVDLNPLDSASVRFRATIPVGTLNGTHILNTGESSSDETAAQSSNEVDIAVCAPGIAFFKQIDQMMYNEGDPVTFTLTVANTHSTCDVSNLVIADVIDLTLLEDAPILTWSDPPGATSSKVGDTITWDLPSFAASSSINITIQSRLRSGTAGGRICNEASAAFDQTLTPRLSNEVCADIEGGCAGPVPRIETLLGTRAPTRADVRFEWLTAPGADEYDLWRVEEDKTAIPTAGRGAAAPVFDVTGCADPAPTPLTECVDTGAIAGGGVHYYQVRGVCGGTEGAL